MEDERAVLLIERALAEVATGRADEDAPVDEKEARILAAAREQFVHAGVQRSTMDDVARRAGVSRITVYRRFANKDELVERTVQEEFRRYFHQFLVDIAPARTVAERVELGFLSSLRAAQENPLIGGLLQDEPGHFLPSMSADRGRTVATVRAFLAAQLRREQRAGNVSEEIDTELVAEMMVRVSTSFLVIPSHVLDVGDDEQVRALARRFLVPMLGPAAGQQPRERDDQ